MYVSFVPLIKHCTVPFFYKIRIRKKTALHIAVFGCTTGNMFIFISKDESGGFKNFLIPTKAGFATPAAHKIWLLHINRPQQRKFVDVRILYFVKKHNGNPRNVATQSACWKFPDASRKGGVASMQLEI